MMALKVEEIEKGAGELLLFLIDGDYELLKNLGCKVKRLRSKNMFPGY